MKKQIYYSIIIIAVLLIPGIHSYGVKHIVHVGNFYFTPSSLNVNVGDTIRWVHDGGSHTTTSGTIPSGASSWDSPISSSVPAFEYKVTKVGVYNYVCTPHATMGQVGTFTATAAATLSVSPSSQNVLSGAGSVIFNVTSNSAWTAVSNATWCTVTPSGDGDGTISAEYSANPGNPARLATITVTVSGLPPQKVTVNQDGSTVSVEENSSNLVRVYPNPSKGFISLATGTQEFNSQEVTIMDISGKTVAEKTCSGSGLYTFDLTHEPKGYYYIRIKNENSTIVKRIVLID